jgi:hypothetical protein
MHIRTLIAAINPSRKILIWITVTAVAAIPTVWVLSGKISSNRVMENTRLTSLETSVNTVDDKVSGLYGKFDEAEARFTQTYEEGVTEVGEIIKKSDAAQTNQLKFVINNWSEENKKLISDALEMQKETNEAEIDKMIEDAKQSPIYKGDPQFTPLGDNESPPVDIRLKDISTITLDSINRKYKILSVEPTGTGNYNISYRNYTIPEKEEARYFKNR